VLLLTAGVAGCSSSGEGDSSAASDSGGTAEGGDGRASFTSDGADIASGSSGTRTVGAGRVGVQTRQVISVGRVTLEAKDLGTVRDEIDQLLGRFGGYVTDEQTTNDGSGDAERSVLRLRVPAPRFDGVMSAFHEFATVVDIDREATDVTTETIDVAARVRTQEVSLERLRKFLGEAGSVSSMIRLESEIAERESDLGSLRAQQEYLDDQTSLSTIKVTMYRTSVLTATEDDPLADAGFLTGLHNGWQAMLDVLVVAFTVLGAVTPFAVAVALVGVPGWLWYRGARRRRAAPAAPAAPAG
jgi:hypothetical protein